MQALLARAYFQSGQKIEAAETSNTLLNKLPYCMDANMILASILAESKRSEDAQVCRARLYALNPYTAYVSENNPNPEQVPEGAVMIEKLEWKGNQELSSKPEQPEWATSLGIEVNTEGSGEKTPEWLVSTPVDKIDEFNSPDLGVGQQKEPEQPGIIPEWMTEAGLNQSANTVSEMTSQFENEKDVTPAESIAHAEIPEWLKSLAPEEMKEGELLPNTSSGETPSESVPWLGETPPGSTDSIAAWLNELGSEDKTKLNSLSSQNTEEKPDWLEDMSNKSGIEGDFNEVNKPTIVDEQPSQTDHPEPVEEEKAPIEGEIPDWLAGSEPDQNPPEEAPELVNQTGNLEEAQLSELISKREPDLLPET